MEEVLESTSRVMKKASHVRINTEAIGKAVELFKNTGASEQTFWSRDIHYFDGTDETVRWIFVLDTVNHSFWPDPGRPVWTVTYGNKEYSGYEGLAIALKRSMEEGIPVTDADFLVSLDEKTLAYILRGRGEIPMLKQRAQNLREAGRILKEKWKGNAANMIKAASGNARTLVRTIVACFSSFKDEASYKGRVVYFWKRAQLFVSDLYAAFNGMGWGDFKDIEHLTAFADYKLPQVLRHLGILEYGPELARKVDSRIPLKAGSEEEVEIRAATIQAVELLKEALRKENIFCHSAHIDNWLWTLGQNEEYRKKPYHLCRTVFY